METVFLILLLVAGVVAANALYAKFNRVPVAFLQIGAGLLLSLIPLYQKFELKPEVFLFAIISVLMFKDGQNTKIRHFTRQLGTTLSLSVALAVVTVLLVGSTTHWLLPTVAISLAFALGAIITPTDAVAVASLTTKVVVPKSVMSTLENESLLNDASGIVALNLALSAYATGKFSLIKGLGNFLYVFGGGILLGMVVGYLIVLGRSSLIRAGVDTPSVIVPYSLLTPFVVYFLAESVGVSGILAVVMTGLIHGIQRQRLRLTTSQIQITLTTTWTIISSLLNGIVFVLLGVSLPEVIEHIHNQSLVRIFILIGVGLLLYLVMTITRFLWTYFDFARIRAWGKHDKLTNSLIMALGGIHGTITLAMAFSLPQIINGRPFPDRNNIIFIATIVILISLLVPSLVLPLILPNRVEAFTLSELAAAKVEIVDNAIKMVQTRFGASPSVSQVVLTLDGQKVMQGELNRRDLDDLFEQAFNVETAVVNNMVHAGKIDQVYADKYYHLARQAALQNQSGLVRQLKFYFRFVILVRLPWSKAGRLRRELLKQYPSNQTSHEDVLARHKKIWQRMKEIENEPYQEVSCYLASLYDGHNDFEINLVRKFYDERHRRFSGTRDLQDQQNEILIQAFQQEYNFIQNQVAQKKYSRALANKLNAQISVDQTFLLQSISND
ncbi:cation:proton antiporter [Lapidilactobacillus luobeiensis]|uniref:cation:proton antiporter n=1 Tax=Lapidilactobacillus luobeiensis TaxID=2950371 RepID=UPI0021C37E0C|nr:sodium:proton antiporter [Lapidilactobacillus luobeiensis]